MIRPPAEVESFLRSHNFGVIVTIRRDGRPQATAVYCLWDGARLLSSTTRTRAKYRNLQRDNRVTFCLLGTDPPFPYVSVYGRADIIEDEAQVLALTTRIRQARGVQIPPDFADILRREQRVVAAITPEHFASEYV